VPRISPALACFGLVVLGACGSAPTETTTITEVTVRSTGGAAPANANRRAVPGVYRAAWRDVTSTDGCFFFSGPADLGRDDHLGTEARMSGGVLELGPALTFREVSPGTWMREAPHEHGGTWTSRETITLTPTTSAFGEGFVGHYHYDELAPGTTAPGTCHIDARLELWP
jgi:hypothetical protein